MYGLEVLEAIKTASGGAYGVLVGSLYPALHKLERKGFVSARWGDDRPRERGGARRRYYTVTALGEQVLVATRQIHEG